MPSNGYLTADAVQTALEQIEPGSEEALELISYIVLQAQEVCSMSYIFNDFLVDSLENEDARVSAASLLKTLNSNERLNLYAVLDLLHN